MPIENCKIHPSVKIWHPELVNLYGCEIGEGSKIGTFVEIGNGVKIGKNCKIQSHVFIPEGITICNRVFVGPGTIFCNVKHPMKGEEYQKTLVCEDVVIGAGSTILPGIILYSGAFIGAGSVVVKNVESKTTVVGNPAKPLKHFATDCKYFHFNSQAGLNHWCGCRQDGSLACKCEDYE